MTGPFGAGMAGADVNAGVSRPREVVASFGTYPEAQRAVDALSDRKFPVEHLAIVGQGLKMVEQVTGRRNWGTAAWQGALSGAVIGLFIGFFFGLFSFTAPVVSAFALALYGLLFGAVVGLLFGLISYAFSGGRRDFNSVSGVQAERYDVLADSEVAAQARQLIGGM